MARESNDHYQKPNWWLRSIENRLVPFLRPGRVSRLSVLGRRSGRWRSVPVTPFVLEGHGYVVSAFGESDWSHNLREEGKACLSTGRTELDVRAIELPTSERAPIIGAYVKRFRSLPGVAAAFRRLPDPADHPVFELEALSRPRAKSPERERTRVPVSTTG
jgi:deazaflavin-dependent oxidoreductase (nitroreductase family)